MDYGSNYVTPNKFEPEDDGYLKLDNRKPGNEGTAEFYDTINEPAQPQYEILPGEAGEAEQYLDYLPNHDKEEMQYLDVHPPPDDEEIYSDISESLKQQALENDQELEIYD